MAKVLVVDDEPSLRAAIAFDFRRRGFEVLEAENGQEAFNVAMAQKPDLVLSDVRMPGGDGVEFLERIKAANPDMPVVMFITGFADLTMEEAYGKGADAVFSKPFDRKALMAAVESALITKESRWAPKQDASAKMQDFKIELKFDEYKTAVEGHKVAFGRGGTFLALEGALPRLNSHGEFCLRFADGDLGEVRGRGVVRWIRARSENGLPPGCGIEFVDIDDQARARIIALIEQGRLTPFIPRG